MPSKPFAASIRVRPRKDGSIAYDVRYRTNGASRTQSFNIATGAEKWANILRQVGPEQAIALLGLGTGDTSPSVNEYAETYINGKSGVEGKTLDHYRMYMRLHIGPAFGELPIDAVGTKTISQWVNDQTDRGNAAKSIRNRHGFLSAMFQNAVDDGLLDRNPCARTGLPESETDEMVFLSPDEFTTLLGYIPEHYQALVLLLATTGLRWGEATALKPGDIDLDAQTVRVSRAWKSSKSRGWYLGAPKTKRSKRTISFPDNLVPSLRPLMGGEYLFTKRSGSPVRQSNFWSEVWDPARRLANGLPAFEKSKADPTRPWTARTGGVWARTPAAQPIGKHPRIHDLRHSHASWLLGAGVGIDVVSRRLGHESIQTTVNIYGHITEERMFAAAGAIGTVLAGAMPQLESA